MARASFRAATIVLAPFVPPARPPRQRGEQVVVGTGEQLPTRRLLASAARRLPACGHDASRRVSTRPLDQGGEAFGLALGCRDDRLRLLIGMPGHSAVAGDVVANRAFDRLWQLAISGRLLTLAVGRPGRSLPFL